MLVITKGWGILGLLTPIGTILGFALYCILKYDRLGHSVYFETHSWPLTSALFLGGIINVILGTKLNRNSPIAQTEDWREKLNAYQHSMYWLPIQAWGWLTIAAAPIVHFLRAS